MMRTLPLILGLLFALLPAATTPAPAADSLETPSLEEAVKAGKLPPLAERLPKTPRVIDLAAMGRQPGKHGGTIRMLIGNQKDIRLMVQFGYARMVGYDKELNIVPDILESFDVQDGRIFTFKLREGHKWSDGTPFTSEDFRYALEDVLLDEELSPGGLEAALLVNGKGPHLETPDPFTVRYTWEEPNPDFLPGLAGALPIFIAMPSQYLKQYHKKYASAEDLDKRMKDGSYKDWVQMHTRLARQYRPENPDLPTLDPWMNRTAPPAEQFVFERNPYYHRVDEAGRQLPYVDRFVLNVSSTTLIPAKTGAGEADLQGRYISFDDYTFLKESEQRYPMKVRLWTRAQGSQVAIQPNLNYEDAGWRKVLQDARFRRALSLAMNRDEINQVVYLGLATPAADSPLPGSALYKEEFERAWADFDPDQANKLLDEMGLDKRDTDGVRLLPDSRRAELIVESSGESTTETDVLELVSDHWAAVGLKLFVRTSQRDVFRSRVAGGQTMISVWSGLDNGIPTGEMSPLELAPTQEVQLQWPQWGLNYISNGQKGTPPDLAEAQKLLELHKSWRKATSADQREQIWLEMLKIYTDNVFSIGTVHGAMQPIVAHAALRNVPDEAFYTFEPGGFFGVHMPDTFWYETTPQ